MNNRRQLRTFLLAGSLALAGGWVWADEAAPASTNLVPPEAVDLWFPVGEEIQYTILWGKIPAAVSTASTEWVEHEGRVVLAIRFRTKSNRVVGSIYPVDDFIESLVDPHTFLPIQFTKRLSEGRYRCDETTVFDHERRKATYTNNQKKTSKEYAIDPDTRDLVSFMYSMRTVDLEVGSEQKFRVMADEKMYDLTLKTEKEQVIKLPNYGKVESVQIEPSASFQGLFVRKGKMTVWVSGDERKVITKASIKVPVAHVNLVLDKVSGPGDDEWVVAEAGGDAAQPPQGE
jgi:hypothetical protein